MVVDVVFVGGSEWFLPFFVESLWVFLWVLWFLVILQGSCWPFAFFGGSWWLLVVIDSSW